jgi:hypothetical protein
MLSIPEKRFAISGDMRTCLGLKRFGGALLYPGLSESDAYSEKAAENCTASMDANNNDNDNHGVQTTAFRFHRHHQVADTER